MKTRQEVTKEIEVWFNNHKDTVLVAGSFERGYHPITNSGKICSEVYNRLLRSPEAACIYNYKLSEEWVTIHTAPIIKRIYDRERGLLIYENVVAECVKELRILLKLKAESDGWRLPKEKYRTLVDYEQDELNKELAAHLDLKTVSVYDLYTGGLKHRRGFDAPFGLEDFNSGAIIAAKYFGTSGMMFKIEYFEDVVLIKVKEFLRRSQDSFLKAHETPLYKGDFEDVLLCDSVYALVNRPKTPGII